MVCQILGLRLTQKKLAQTVPFVGVGLNAALSASLTERTFRRAQAVYRFRTPSETYGIDPQEWMSGAPAPAPENGESVVDVMAVLDAETKQQVRYVAGKLQISSNVLAFSVYGLGWRSSRGASLRWRRRGGGPLRRR